jgi:hypothetical protein
MKRTIITLSATVALATMVATLGSLHTTHAQNQSGGSVVGTWLNSVSVDVGNGASVHLADEFVTFGPGGTFADIFSIAFNGENPAFAGTALAANFSDALGSWRSVGDGSQVAGTFKRFIFASPSTPLAYGPGPYFPGQNIGVASIEFVGTLSSSGQVLSGSFTFQFTDLQGNLVAPGSGKFSATPLKIQPLTH